MISLTKWLKNTKCIGFSQTHLDIFKNFVQNSVFFLQNFIVHEANVAAKRGGVRQILTGLTKGEGGLRKC